MARKTLSQRISFEGGEEFLSQLREIGKVGERVFGQLAKVTSAANAPNTKLAASMGRVRDSMKAARATGERLGKTFSTIGQRAARLRATLATVARRMTGLAAAALGAAAAIAAMARSGARAAAEAGRAAAGLNITVENLTRLKFAASQAGLGAGKLQAALGTLNKKLGESAEKSKKATNELEATGFAHRSFGKATDLGARAAAFAARQMEKGADESDNFRKAIKDLGLSLSELTSGGADAAFKKIAEALERFPDGVDKARIAFALFEGLGPDIISFSNEVGASLDALGAESDRIGNTFFKNAEEIGKAFDRARDKLGKAVGGLRNAIGLLFAPALTLAADQQTEAIIRHRVALLDLVDGVVPKAVALVEDLVAALSGRDADVRAKWIITARDAIVAFARDVRAAFVGIILPAFNGLVRIFDVLAAAVNEAFGTEFRGRTLLIAAAVAQLLGVFSGLGTVVLAVSALLLGVLPGAIEMIKDVVAAIQGRDQDVRARWILEWRDAFISVGKVIRDTINNIIIPAFKLLLRGADIVAGILNKIFGTQLTGKELILAVVVAKVLGLFTTFAAILVTVNAAIGITVALIKGIAVAASIAVAALVGWPALIVSGLVLAVAAVVLFWDEIKAGFAAAWNFVAETAAEAWRLIGDLVDAAADRMVARFKTAVDVIGKLLRGLANLAKRAFKAAKSALGFSGGGAAEGSGFVGGGAVTGPGTKTSDSIPARLSRGEYVIRAAAVDRYGPRLFAALNNLRLPKTLLPGFSLGGLVDGITASLASLAPMPMPAYAMGGAVAAASGGSSGRPVTIVLDGQRFNLSAEDSVAEALTRTALGQQRRRAGRMPGWFGG